MTYRLGSLFSGIGGLELGFEMTGMFETVFQVERDPWAQRVLAKHWPHVPRYDDVRTVGAHDLPACDVLVGGFPCQDVSLAGKGAGLEGERSGLWWEYHRIISEVRPAVAVVENVPGLFVRGIDAVLGSLAEIGYDASWEVVSAASQGAPHVRERVFIVAYPNRGRLRGRGALDRDGREVPQEGPLGQLRGSRGRQDVADTNGEPASGWACGVEGRPALVAAVAGGAEPRGAGAAPRTADVADASSGRRLGWRQDAGSMGGSEEGERRGLLELAGRGASGGVWPPEPDVGRVADGIPARLDRLRGLGNAVVPQVAYFVAQRVLESGLLAAELEVAA